jgi:hypothetical protein
MILISTLFTLISCILCRKSWECLDNKHFCQEHQTCCNSTEITNPNVVYNCLDAQDGYCCSDKSTGNLWACPGDSWCNWDTQGCSGTNPWGMSDQKFPSKNNKTEDDYPATKIIPFGPTDAGDLFEGFMKGLTIFNKLPHALYCDYRHLELIQVDVMNIIDTIRKVKWDLEIINQFGDVFVYFKRIYNDSRKIVGECEQFGKEMAGEMDDVIKHVISIEFFQAFPEHTAKELDNFQKKAEFATEIFNQGDYSYAGRIYGNLINDVLLWNYKQLKKSNIK